MTSSNTRVTNFCQILSCGKGGRLIREYYIGYIKIYKVTCALHISVLHTKCHHTPHCKSTQELDDQHISNNKSYKALTYNAFFTEVNPNG